MAGSRRRVEPEGAAAASFEPRKTHLAPTTAYKGRGSREELLELLKTLDLRSLAEVEHLETRYRGGPRPARTNEALNEALNELRAEQRDRAAVETRVEKLEASVTELTKPDLPALVTKVADLEAKLAKLEAAETRRKGSTGTPASSGEPASSVPLEQTVAGLQRTVAQLERSLARATPGAVGAPFAYLYGRTWVVAEPENAAGGKADSGQRE